MMKMGGLELLLLAVGEGEALGRGEGLGVHGGGEDVTEAREDPVVLLPVLRLHVMHGILVAQGLVHGERIPPGGAAAGLEGGLGCAGHETPSAGALSIEQNGRLVQQGNCRGVDLSKPTRPRSGPPAASKKTPRNQLPMDMLGERDCRDKMTIYS
jgi:hypothetical protein